MIAKGFFLRTNTAGVILCAAFLGTLTGCIGYVERARPGDVYVAPSAVQTTIIIEDDYVYYPNYECYYSARRHQYAYRDGRNWVSRPAPRGVTVDVLFASPSVRMNFHDSPARHHDAIVRQYPKNWSPPAKNQEHKEKRKDEERDQRNQHDQRRDNNGR